MKKQLLRTLLFTGFICTSFPIGNDNNNCNEKADEPKTQSNTQKKSLFTLDEAIKKCEWGEKEIIEIIEKKAQEENSNEIFSELQLFTSNMKAVRNKIQEKVDKELKNTTKDPILAKLQACNLIYKKILHLLELENQTKNETQLQDQPQNQ
jgi:hypothetical protein